MILEDAKNGDIIRMDGNFFRVEQYTTCDNMSMRRLKPIKDPKEIAEIEQRIGDLNRPTSRKRESKNNSN